jgi:hypothetical protein
MTRQEPPVPSWLKPKLTPDYANTADGLRERARRAEAEVERYREALRAIERNDKTIYEYDGEHAPNREGRVPDEGRWSTPREIARDALSWGRRLAR